ncbi:MAG: hypothetical protein IJZ94_04980 [Clostridia bacterium]|nr:hypothetical protein [Clostridia bacterium]
MNKDSLLHTSWNCNYHVFFVPKFRRAEIYGRLKDPFTGKQIKENSK